MTLLKKLDTWIENDIRENKNRGKIHSNPKELKTHHMKISTHFFKPHRNLYVDVHVSVICNKPKINLYQFSIAVKHISLKFNDVKQQIFIVTHICGPDTSSRWFWVWVSREVEITLSSGGGHLRSRRKLKGSLLMGLMVVEPVSFYVLFCASFPEEMWTKSTRLR